MMNNSERGEYEHHCQKTMNYFGRSNLVASYHDNNIISLSWDANNEIEIVTFLDKDCMLSYEQCC